MQADETQGMVCKRGKPVRVPVGCAISLLRSRKKMYFADRGERYVFSIWIFGSGEMLSPFTRKMKRHRVVPK